MLFVKEPEVTKRSLGLRAIGAGFRGFAGRSEKRCRKIGNLQSARAAASETVLLHHPVLLESEAVTLRVASAIEKVLSSGTARSAR